MDTLTSEQLEKIDRDFKKKLRRLDLVMYVRAEDGTWVEDAPKPGDQPGDEEER